MAEIKVDVKIVGTEALSALRKLDSASKKAENRLDDLGKTGKSSLDKVGKAAKGINLGPQIFASVLAVDVFRKGLQLLSDTVVSIFNEIKEFEKGLIGVGKTADISGDELVKFGRDLRNLDITASNDELLDLAKTAGQLGVTGTSNILRFTEVMAKLESATDVAGSVGASSIARILNITKTGVTEIDKFGAALVSLGNTSAATESEILSVATRVAQSTAVYDVSAAETLAFGAALKSLGVAAESGGSSVGKAFKAIDKAIVTGGQNLNNFAELLGVTGDELAQSFKEDKTAVVLKFLEALSKRGDGVNKTLNELGLTDIRVTATLGVLAKNIDIVNKSFKTSESGYRDNIALNEEYGRTLSTIDAEQKLLSRSIDNLSGDIGGTFEPVFRGLLKTARAFSEFLQFRPFDPLIDLFREIKPINVAGLGFDQLESKAKETNQVITDIQDSITRVNLDKLTLPSKRVLILEDYNTQLRLAEANLAKINDRQEQLSKFRTLEDVGDATQDELAKAKSSEEAKTQLLLDFDAARLENRQIALEEEAILKENAQVTDFQRLVQGLGEEETLRISRRVIELNGLKQHEKAKSLLIEAGLRAKKKIQEADDQQSIKDRRDTLNTFATLSRSSNSTLAAIGKAAAITQIAIKTPQAVASSLAWGTTLGGPALGAVFAGITKVAMAAQAAQVAGIGFQDGGIVPGSSFTGDNVQARVNSGEMILNREQQAQLFAQANGQDSGGSKEIVVNTTVQVGEEEIARAVSRQVANGFELGEQV